MPYRIAVGGIHIESSTFSPYISGYGDFVIRRGDDLIKRYPFYEKYKEKVELLPLIHAGALPGGVVDRNFFEEWLSEFTTLLREQLRKGDLDGILFDIHGAMSVQGLEDAEGYILDEVRKIVGKDVRISTSMDLHGNVSDLLFDHTDFITCYRTAPHIDTEETRERAFAYLVKVLDNRGKKIYKSKIAVPILLPGEKTSTEVSPGKELYEQLSKLCDGEAVFDVAIWMGFPWADEARCHGVVTAVGFDREKVEAANWKVAKDFFDVRENFSFIGPTDNLRNSVIQALDFKGGPFFISDTGDNPGAGGVGDMNLVLKDFVEVLRERKTEKKVLFASIFDSDSIEKIYSHLDNERKERPFFLDLGGKKDLSFGGPVRLEVIIRHLFQDERAGKGALVQSGNLFVIVTENRFQYGSLASFVKSGVPKLDDYDIVVVKMGYLEPDLSKAAKGWVMALTKGAVSQDIVNISYQNLSSPLFPFQALNEMRGEELKLYRGAN